LTHAVAINLRLASYAVNGNGLHSISHFAHTSSPMIVSDVRETFVY